MNARQALPETWQAESLGQLGQWFSGGTPSLKNAAYWYGDTPWVSPKDMKRPRLWDSIDHIGSQAIADGARVLPAGTVLIVVRGMILAHSLPVARAERPMAFNQDIKALAPHASVDSEFVLYWLEANKQTLRALITESTHGTKRLPTEALFEQEVQCPPLTEQRAIAAALSDAEVLLGSLDALIAKKLDLKQAAMQQLLTGLVRLGGFQTEWLTRPLGSVVASLEAGVSVNSVEGDVTGGPCILKTSAVAGGRFDPRERKLIAPDDRTRAKLNPERDTIIISRMNTPSRVGEVGYVPADFPELRLPDRLWMTRFHPGSHVSAKWLAYLLSSSSIKEAIKGLATGTSGSMKNISKHDFMDLPLKFPPPDEQRAIGNVLSDMDAELAALEARRDKTRALKQGMMQELLTGRIRLI